MSNSKSVVQGPVQESALSEADMMKLVDQLMQRMGVRPTQPAHSAEASNAVAQFQAIRAALRDPTNALPPFPNKA